MVNRAKLSELDASEIKHLLVDGSYGGGWQKSDEIMHDIWSIGVEETRDVLREPW